MNLLIQLFFNIISPSLSEIKLRLFSPAKCRNIKKDVFIEIFKSILLNFTYFYINKYYNNFIFIS